MGGAVVSRLVVLTGGTLYPAYASYKAVKSANVRQYVRWMMYWVVFAIFTTVETFTDLFLSWLPFYYEIKVGFVIWLLSPYTKGAAFLYRKFVHPILSKREPEIDSFLTSAKQRSYATMLDVGSRGINVAANAMVTAAVKGQAVMSDRLKSFSVNDLSRLSDETPIHSMNPAPYNPPIQREVLSGTADVSSFEVVNMPLTRPAMQHQASSSQVGMDTGAPMYEDMMLPPSGSIMSSGAMTMQPLHPGSGDYHTNLASQYKAYSMMNLSQSAEYQGSSVVTRTIEFTSAPPVASVDDSVIPDPTRYMGDEQSFSTLPRQRKKKHKKDKEKDPSVRRSKRRIKTLSYHDGSGEEQEEE